MRLQIIYLFLCGLVAASCSNVVSYEDTVATESNQESGYTNQITVVHVIEEGNDNKNDVNPIARNEPHFDNEIILVNTSHTTFTETAYKDTVYDTIYVYAKKFRKYTESKEMEEYPYYELVDGFWHYDDWQPLPLFNPELFNSVTHPVLENLPNKIETLSYGQTLDVNSLVSFKGNFGFLVFSFTDSTRYMLSFDKVEGTEPPFLKVTPYHFEGNAGYLQKSTDSIVAAIEYNGRWYYPLDSDVFGPETNYADLVLFNKDFSPFLQPLTHISVSDRDYGYPLDFEINLIIVGKYAEPKDTVSPDLLAKRIQDRINLALNPGGINVRKVNVLYAKDHPIAGENFPETQEFTAYRRSYHESTSANNHLGKWPGHEGEINFALFHSVEDTTEHRWRRILGFAPLKGEIYTGDNKGDYVTISSNDLTSSVIANVAIHELGHFFGLEHTSDDEYGYEYDPFDDTPECDSTDFYHNCPDYGYIMFPTEDYHYSHSKFTTQQMEIIRYYLYSHAHK